MDIFLLSSYVADEFKIRKKAFTKKYNDLWRHNISFSIQLARILITLSHIQQHSAKLFIHSSLRPRMSGRSLPISTTLRILNDGIQRKLDIERLEKKTSHKAAKPLRFASLLASWSSEKCTYHHEQNKKAHGFHEHKRERRKERKKKYTGWFTKLKSWDYKGHRGASSQHAKQRNRIPQSDPLSCLCCAQLHWFWGKPMKFQNSFQFFLCFLFFIIFGIKLKPTSFTAWREKLGKQGGKSGKIRTCIDIYCLF